MLGFVEMSYRGTGRVSTAGVGMSAAGLLIAVFGTAHQPAGIGSVIKMHHRDRSSFRRDSHVTDVAACSRGVRPAQSCREWDAGRSWSVLLMLVELPPCVHRVPASRCTPSTLTSSTLLRWDVSARRGQARPRWVR